MGIFKKIFGKRDQKASTTEPNSGSGIQVSSLDQLTEMDIDEAVSKIKEKRKQNQKKFNENYKKAESLINKGQYQKAQKLTSEDVTGYFQVYSSAEKLEKAGKLEDAAKTYWRNIFENGTDAPANFKRLLIVLSKLGRKKEELSVALIYLAFVKEKEREKIKKRIENIRKKLDSKD